MVTHDHGSTAIAGIIYYAADQFPEAYRGTVFIGNVVTNRINHDRIEWHGSTPKGIEQPDFVWSEDNWFRPGGHRARPRRCPVRRRLLQPDHRPLRGAADPPRPRPRARPDLADRLPRHRRQAAARPRRRSIGPGPPIAELVADLGHPNLAVRISAANQLVERGGEPAVAAVRKIMTAGEPRPPARPRPLGPRTARSSSTTPHCWPAPPTPIASCASMA